MAYQPYNETEQQHKEEILRQWNLFGDEIFKRPDGGHFTASSIILNPAMDKMLMVYHNIYQSLPWVAWRVWWLFLSMRPTRHRQTLPSALHATSSFS